VGRIMGVVNRKHNEMFNTKNARFSFMECYEDKEVFAALIGDIEQWGKNLGMNKIIGPFTFSDREMQGFLIEGFEHEPVVDSASNFEFMPKLLSGLGYEKELDCVIYRYPLSNPLPEIYDRIYDRVMKKKTMTFIEFTSHSQLKPYVVPVLRLVNESFGDIYGFIAMTENEMHDLAKRYLPLLDHRFVKIALKDDKVVAMMIAMPNMYKGLQKAKGRLFPFGILHILRAIKKATTINTMLGAVHPDYQKQGLDVFLSMTTIKSAKKAGMTSVDTHVVMEENNDMMGELKRYGAHLLKKFRVYQKVL
jgi:GNAT superfamily N-acetyltransferase